MLFEVPGWNLGEPKIIPDENAKKLKVPLSSSKKRVSFGNDVKEPKVSKTEEKNDGVEKISNNANDHKRKKNKVFNKDSHSFEQSSVTHSDANSDFEKTSQAKVANISKKLKNSNVNNNRKNNSQKDTKKESHSLEQPSIKHDDDDASFDHKAAKVTNTSKKLTDQMAGARFRFLNQKLYQSSSQESLEYFRENERDFLHYHTGFTAQVSKWPVNPVQVFIRRLEERLVKASKVSLRVADLGCGDAKIAAHFDKKQEFRGKIKVDSFDLAALNEHVVVASMTEVPLPDASIDVAIFCLSLMNTDCQRALMEARRILKPSGSLWIAEVESRFDKNAGGIDAFSAQLAALGFRLVGAVDTSNPVFLLFTFEKTKGSLSKEFDDSKPLLKPCLYKKR